VGIVVCIEDKEEECRPNEGNLGEGGIYIGKNLRNLEYMNMERRRKNQQTSELNC